jgi:putative transferase (TIGR04331 family)
MAPKSTARKLVLTSHSALNTSSFKHTLLLGRWCLEDYTVNIDNDVVISPYHWDDRDKMHSDFLYTNKVYEHILSILSVELNKIHKVTHSQRYWRILIGPWLYTFIPTLFDKWELVRLASENFNISSVDLLDYDYERFVINEFRDIDPDDINWMHYLLSESIKFQNKISWTTIKPVPYEYVNKSSHIKKLSFFEKIGLSINSFLCRFKRQDEFFFINTYIPKAPLIKLYLSLRIFPKVWKIPKIPTIEINKRVRCDWDLYDNKSDKFTQFSLSMIALQIPKVYLEGYESLEKIVLNLPWPKNPSVIFTSNSFQFCEPFQMWAAKKVESGSKLIIGQHGGFYGSGRWHCGEKHQVKIADKFISWGWRDNRSSIVRGSVLTNIGKTINKWDNNGSLLFVTMPVRLISYKDITWPIGPNQALSFLNDQMKFIDAISNDCKESLIVRINKKQDEKMRSLYLKKIKESSKQLIIDDSSTPIENQIKKCRVFVYSCNSTGYLETLARGIPTVIFWDPGLFELRDSAKPFFDKLKVVGILHYDPISAANHISKHWNNIENWWLDAKVQDAVSIFCNNYAHTSNNPIKELKRILQLA